MSRTFKDKPAKLSWNWGQDVIPCERCCYRLGKTTKPKKRKEVDTEDHWMSTPGWWIRLMMGKPERRAAHTLEKKVLMAPDLEDVDFPDLGRKPHIYYW